MRARVRSFLRRLPLAAALLSGSLVGAACAPKDAGGAGDASVHAHGDSVTCEKCQAQYRLVTRTSGNGPPNYFLEKVAPPPTASDPAGGLYMMQSGRACPTCGATLTGTKRFPWEKP